MSMVSVLEVEVRKLAGKGAARAVRREGKVPAIVYGGGQKELLISLNQRELGKELLRPGFRSRVVELKNGSEKILALPRDVQYHPVSDAPEHVDFLRLNKSEKVNVFVKVNFANADKAPGIRRGGVLNIVRHDVELLCLPEHIPASITVDLTGLEIGRSVHASDVKLPQGVEYSLKRDFTIATVAGRMAEETETAAPTMSAADVQATAQKAPEAAAAPAAGAKAPAAKAAAAPAKADAKK